MLVEISRLSSRQIIDVQIGAPNKRFFTNCWSVSPKIKAGQVSAVCESKSPDVGNAWGDHDAGQTSAKSERQLLNTGDAVGDSDIYQPATTIKS